MDAELCRAWLLTSTMSLQFFILDFSVQFVFYYQWLAMSEIVFLTSANKCYTIFQYSLWWFLPVFDLCSLPLYRNDHCFPTEDRNLSWSWGGLCAHTLRNIMPVGPVFFVSHQCSVTPHCIFRKQGTILLFSTEYPGFCLALGGLHANSFVTMHICYFLWRVLSVRQMQVRGLWFPKNLI